MVHIRAAPELGCDDADLGASPAVSTSSSASHCSSFPARTRVETLPFECDQDHDEELNFMLQREARYTPSHSWLSTQPVLSAQHRRFLVAWMQRVSTPAPAFESFSSQYAPGFSCEAPRRHTLAGCLSRADTAVPAFPMPYCASCTFISMC